MKKFIALLLTCLMSISFFGACENDSSVKVYVPDGAPTLAILQLLTENNQFDGEVEYNVVPSNEISAAVLPSSSKGCSVLQGDADIAIVPVTAASKILGDRYKMLGVVTHGNLYVVAREKINSVSDLEGKTVGVINQGNVPDLTFRAVLADNDVTCNIVYYQDASELIPALKKGTVQIGVLPEPAVTKLTTTVDTSYSVQLDLQEEMGGDYPQAVLVAKTDFIEANAEFIRSFIEAIKANENYIKQALNVEGGITNVKDRYYSSTTLDASAFNEAAVKNSNIYFKSALEEKQNVINYLNKLKAIEPNSVGTLAEGFFYGA